MVDDQTARNLLVQNCLILIGIATAAQMSDAGRKVIFDGLVGLIAYLTSPTDEKVLENITPLYPMYG